MYMHVNPKSPPPMRLLLYYHHIGGIELPRHHPSVFSSCSFGLSLKIRYRQLKFLRWVNNSSRVSRSKW